MPRRRPEAMRATILRIRHAADAVTHKKRGYRPAVIVVSVPDALEDVICNLIDHFRELIKVLERKSGYKGSILRILRPVPGKNQSRPDSVLLRRADHSEQRLVDEDGFVHSLNVEDNHNTLPCMHAHFT